MYLRNEVALKLERQARLPTHILEYICQIADRLTLFHQLALVARRCYIPATVRLWREYTLKSHHVKLNPLIRDLFKRVSTKSSFSELPDLPPYFHRIDSLVVQHAEFYSQILLATQFVHMCQRSDTLSFIFQPGTTQHLCDANWYNLLEAVATTGAVSKTSVYWSVRPIFRGISSYLGLSSLCLGFVSSA